MSIAILVEKKSRNMSRNQRRQSEQNWLFLSAKAGTIEEIDKRHIYTLIQADLPKLLKGMSSAPSIYIYYYYTSIFPSYDFYEMLCWRQPRINFVLLETRGLRKKHVFLRIRFCRGFLQQEITTDTLDYGAVVGVITVMSGMCVQPASGWVATRMSPGLDLPL